MRLPLSCIFVVLLVVFQTFPLFFPSPRLFGIGPLGNSIWYCRFLFLSNFRAISRFCESFHSSRIPLHFRLFSQSLVGFSSALLNSSAIFRRRRAISSTGFSGVLQFCRAISRGFFFSADEFSRESIRGLLVGLLQHMFFLCALSLPRTISRSTPQARRALPSLGIFLWHLCSLLLFSGPSKSFSLYPFFP